MPRKPKRSFKKVCVFCQNNCQPDYKDQDILRRLTTDRGKIVPRRLNGCCAKHQRGLATAIKRARHMAILPFVAENLK